MGNGASATGPNTPPSWIHTVKFSPNFYKDGFSRVSPGCKCISLNTIVRCRKGCVETDGAIWSKGFNSGRHVFEVVFPQKQRTPYASIGVGVQNIELYSRRATALVGQTRFSWGIDLSSKKVFANGMLIGKFPGSIFSKLPDRFFMYIDMVNFRLMFGSDGKYYGTAIEDANMKNYTVYPMVSVAREGAVVTMVYRGKGKVVKGPIRKKRKVITNLHNKVGPQKKS